MKYSNKILIIDDDLDIRITLKDALEYEGFGITTAIHGEDGLETFESEGIPLLIFLDIHMPVMNGHEFIRTLRSNDAYDKVPVIVMSAGADLKDFKNADRTIKKPFDLDEIVATIAALLSEKSFKA